ncbi:MULTISPECIES: CrpP-related protein [unclassified Sinorhizobium]|uniref:CrpP-related protein n=1 Tax=unclassified Sinorhizobium TaxID=2613772 RepID=UPI0035265AA8
MSIEELIDLQEQGSRARTLGLQLHDNPYLQPGRMPLRDSSHLADWLARHDAWRFGWEAEDASLKGKISAYFKAIVERPAGKSPH